MAQTKEVTKILRSLHIPGSPLILANVYDSVTANAVGSLPRCRALATASAAIAHAAGIEDDDLDLATNMTAIRAIGKVARELNLPLTADLQDGYGEDLGGAIKQVVEAGASGINLEDVDKETQLLLEPQAAAERVFIVMRIAGAMGLPDFVVNARCDALLKGGTINDVIERGKLYLEAGATCIFVWGGRKRGGITKEEVIRLTEAFSGKLSVIMKLPVGTGLNVAELADIGVCRASVGPQLQAMVADACKREAANMLN